MTNNDKLLQPEKGTWVLRSLNTGCILSSKQSEINCVMSANTKLVAGCAKYKLHAIYCQMDKSLVFSWWNLNSPNSSYKKLGVWGVFWFWFCWVFSCGFDWFWFEVVGGFIWFALVYFDCSGGFGGVCLFCFVFFLWPLPSQSYAAWQTFWIKWYLRNISGIESILLLDIQNQLAAWKSMS